MSAEVTIRCHLCKGTGLAVLTGEYLDTFLKLAEATQEMSGADMARLMGVPPTAMNNRLVALERHGLATSRRYGRKRLFRAATLVAGADA